MALLLARILFTSEKFTRLLITFFEGEGAIQALVRKLYQTVQMYNKTKNKVFNNVFYRTWRNLNNNTVGKINAFFKQVDLNYHLNRILYKHHLKLSFLKTNELNYFKYLSKKYARTQTQVIHQPQKTPHEENHIRANLSSNQNRLPHFQVFYALKSEALLEGAFFPVYYQKHPKHKMVSNVKGYTVLYFRHGKPKAYHYYNISWKLFQKMVQATQPGGNGAWSVYLRAKHLRAQDTLPAIKIYKWHLKLKNMIDELKPPFVELPKVRGVVLKPAKVGKIKTGNRYYKISNKAIARPRKIKTITKIKPKQWRRL